MPIALILAILELIIKMPEIVQMIRDLIEWIHNRPLHLQGALLMRLHSVVLSARQSGDAADLKSFHASLKP